VPNAQVGVCVIDGTYYKITVTNYISKSSLYTTFRMYPSGPWPLKIFFQVVVLTTRSSHSSTSQALTKSQDFKERVTSVFE